MVLRSNLRDHPEAVNEFVLATLSLLVLLTLSGSMVAFVAGVSGYPPKIGAEVEEGVEQPSCCLR
jgi:hypothetical protein